MKKIGKKEEKQNKKDNKKQKRVKQKEKNVGRGNKRKKKKQIKKRKKRKHEKKRKNEKEGTKKKGKERKKKVEKWRSECDGSSDSGCCTSAARVDRRHEVKDEERRKEKCQAQAEGSIKRNVKSIPNCREQFGARSQNSKGTRSA